MNQLTSPEVKIIDGRPITTSLAVAKCFGKQHNNVIRKIETLECSPEFIEHNFVLNEYIDPVGRKLPSYEITKDGFVFLVMGFTGKKAAAFKEAYIEAFNRMEAELYPPQTLLNTRILHKVVNGEIVSTQAVPNDAMVFTEAEIAYLLREGFIRNAFLPDILQAVSQRINEAYEMRQLS